MADDKERRLAEAIAAYIDLAARQETVDFERFYSQYADIGAELHEQIHALNSIEQPSPLPATLSGYRILNEIGSGGMGRVLLAIDDGLNRRVAIKTLKPEYEQDALLRERFLNEARALARLSHPRIVQIYRLGAPDEVAHFVMEWIDGKPLNRACGTLDMRQKADLVRRVALAVDFLHQNHFVHRDLKPANVLVGADGEPRLLDFGLALQLADVGSRLTLAGAIAGTPDYLSPEQALGKPSLDPRSDIFALGVILYEALTGRLPFAAPGLQAMIREICESDPVLPRRIDRTIPGELQNICMKALEKDPMHRYASARDMAADIERFLAGEPVLAAPASYVRVMRAKIEQHVGDLEGWMQDRLITPDEYDSLRKRFDQLVEREDAWILEARRLTLSQVTLYLGAWVLAVGAALLVLFRYPDLHGLAAVAAVIAVTAPALWMGLRFWKSERYRIGIAFLLAFCLLLPVGWLVALGEAGLLAAFTSGREDLEFFSLFPSFRLTTNAQLCAALAFSLPAYLGLRRFTQSSVFSLVLATAAALLCLAALLRLGMLDWLSKDPGKLYFNLIPCALIFFVVAWALERLGQERDSRYFYPPAVAFTLIALSGIAAFHEPYAQWLRSAAPWTRGQVEYLFLLNAGFYLALQAALERAASSQVRMVAKAFRFVLPGHVMGSLLFLGISARPGTEARFFEVLLPVAACGFVLGSVPKQMKNFFVSGLVFLAIGIVRLQQDLLRDQALWPLALLIAGLTIMLLASGYSRLRLGVERFFARKK